ncbi:MAG: hypothetical protein M3O71_07315 [Bacteroidota bacterium]|nr:hypothetical protein [Bacteroidota bacterium]
MIVTFNKAEIVEDENGKKFLDLELQAFIPGTKVIIKNVFPATSNYATNELPQLPADTEVVLRNTTNE